MARVRGTLNRYKESDYIFVTVERFGEKKKRKVKRSSILTTTLNPRRLFLFLFFFCLVTSLPFFDGLGGKSI